MLDIQPPTFVTPLRRAAARRDVTATPDPLAGLVRELGIRLGDSALAVGCAGSLFSPLIVATGGLASLMALDLSAKTLRCVCNRVFAPPCLRADPARLPFKSRMFAWVICNATFPPLADKPAALREFSRILGASGRLVICQADERNRVDAIPHRFGDVVRRNEPPSSAQLIAWLAQVGLRPLIVRTESTRYLVVAGHDHLPTGDNLYG